MISPRMIVMRVMRRMRRVMRRMRRVMRRVVMRMLILIAVIVW